MSDALRVEVEDEGIDVVLVEPGPVDTSFQDRAADEVDDGLDRSEAYASFYKAFDDADAISGGGFWEETPERVAEDVVNAASATKPAARYPVGTVAQVAVLGRFVPDSLRDKLFGVVRKLS
jgi:short-subunit dehydrogenase